MQEVFGFVKRNLSGAQRRMDSASGERGVGKGRQPFAPPQRTVTRSAASASAFNWEIISSSLQPAVLTRARERKRHAAGALDLARCELLMDWCVQIDCVQLINRRRLSLSFAAALVSCQPRPRGADAIGSIFSGFDFVGEFPLNDQQLESHRHESATPVAIWLPGPHYVFHLNEDRDFEEIPTRLLRARLSAIGATIIGGPKDWRDMGIPNVGNPIWVIEFALLGTRGTIRNQYDKSRRTEFSNSAKLLKNLPIHGLTITF